MAFITYGLIGLYAGLTGTAGSKQWKEEGFKWRTFLFIIVSISIIVILFMPNKVWMFSLLILAFVALHILAVAEGLLKFGRINYHHHFIRFIFHCIILLIVYKFIIKVV